MMPDWMKAPDAYEPPRGSNAFVLKTIRTFAGIMARVRIQRGHEKGRPLPAALKLLLLLIAILVIAVSRQALILLAVLALLLGYLCLWPARDIWNILKTSLAAAALALVLLCPAMLMDPGGLKNDLLIALKVFLCVSCVSVFHHTTQWNHITGALRRLHVPGIFIFTLDITIKYIVLLGRLITDLLTSLQLRSVGKSRGKYASVGGIMGVVFLRGTEMNRQMYEAMLCRGFTDDYEGL